MKVLTLSDNTLARLQGMTWPTVFDGKVVEPAPAAGWAVFYPGAGSIERGRHSSVGDHLRWTCLVVCAGRSRSQVTNTVDAVRDRLIGWPPDPVGDPITEIPLDAPMQRDDSNPQDIRFSITLQFTLGTARS
jgi:hypothetical protein